MSEPSGLRPLDGFLAYVDPAKWWGLVREARRRHDDPVFWKGIHDDLARQGASIGYADKWVSGLRGLVDELLRGHRG